MELEFEGIYTSNGEQMEVASSNGYVKYVIYYFYLFNSDSKVYLWSKINDNTITKDEMLSCGDHVRYFLEENFIKIILNENTKYEVHKVLNILAKYVLQDQSGIIIHFSKFK